MDVFIHFFFHFSACTNCPKKELAPKSRSRSSSANEASKPISFGRKWPSSGGNLEREHVQGGVGDVLVVNWGWWRWRYCIFEIFEAKQAEKKSIEKFSFWDTKVLFLRIYRACIFLKNSLVPFYVDKNFWRFKHSEERCRIIDWTWSKNTYCYQFFYMLLRKIKFYLDFDGKSIRSLEGSSFQVIHDNFFFYIFLR